MKKVYIARRIPTDPNPECVLSISSEMSPEEIRYLYVNKIQDKESYIYNGPWILRPPLPSGDFEKSKLPKALKPYHIWDMVKRKIEDSDIVVGIVNCKAYGTIAELGYASSIPSKACYVLPDKKMIDDDYCDLWFIFQIVRNTERFWSDVDIQSISEFKSFGIDSVKSYVLFIESVVPKFMK